VAVEAWLNDPGLGQYSEAFGANGIGVQPQWKRVQGTQRHRARPPQEKARSERGTVIAAGPVRHNYVKR
jgi:hypothetical protein